MNARLARVVIIPALLTCALLLAGGCGEDKAQQQAALAEASANLQPDDSELAAIYARSCRSCHTLASTGAPLTGDSAAWQLRLAKGMPQLLNSVVNGFGGMPPFGLCMDCDAAQFEALINFMAQPASAQSGASEAGK